MAVFFWLFGGVFGLRGRLEFLGNREVLGGSVGNC